MCVHARMPCMRSLCADSCASRNSTKEQNRQHKTFSRMHAPSVVVTAWSKVRVCAQLRYTLALSTKPLLLHHNQPATAHP